MSTTRLSLLPNHHLQNVSAFSLLESLNGVCLSRHEGWWSYEFCYKKQMRQFHLVTVTDAKVRGGGWLGGGLWWWLIGEF